jgi:hypothetical protein
MKVVFVLKQSRDLLLVADGYEPRFGEHLFHILDYIVAFRYALRHYEQAPELVHVD